MWEFYEVHHEIRIQPFLFCILGVLLLGGGFLLILFNAIPICVFREKDRLNFLIRKASPKIVIIIPKDVILFLVSFIDTFEIYITITLITGNLCGFIVILILCPNFLLPPPSISFLFTKTLFPVFSISFPFLSFPSLFTSPLPFFLLHDIYHTSRSLFTPLISHVRETIRYLNMYLIYFT